MNTTLRLALGLALGSLALAGCSSTGMPAASSADSSSADTPSGGASSADASSAAPSASSTPSRAPSTRATTAGTSPSSSTSARATAAVPTCTTAELKVSLGAGEGAAGSTYYPLRLTNTSARACRTGGFGGVSLVKALGGAPIGAPADRTRRGQAAALTLQPGARAEATLRATTAENYPPATCRPTAATGLRVYPPDQTRSAFAELPTTACADPAVHLLSLTPYRLLG